MQVLGLNFRPSCTEVDMLTSITWASHECAAVDPVLEPTAVGCSLAVFPAFRTASGLAVYANGCRRNRSHVLAGCC